MEDEQLTSIVIDGSEMNGRISDRGHRFSQRSASSRGKPEVQFGEVKSLREILMRENTTDPRQGDTGENDVEEIKDMENSIVTKQFNKAFQFVEEVAKQSSKDDDVVDANLRNTLL